MMHNPNSGQARARDVVAALTLWGPLAIMVTTWLIWHGQLPADLPRQWNSGGVSSTWPTWLAILLLGLVGLGSAIIAAFALRTDAAASRRKTFLWSGFAAGMASGSWLLVAGSTITSGATAEPQVGAWPVLLIAAMGYGLFPFLIAHRWVDVEPEVDWRGLKVVTWLLGIPLKTVPLKTIESVHTEPLEPAHWGGGWGYRVMPGRSAIILRTGPGIVVDLTSGKQFALSLKESSMWAVQE